jgi:hypothetical protein
VALKQDGSLVAWGLNVKGQSTVPEHLPPAFLLAAGYEHSVLAFVGDAGPAVAGFGSNPDGQADGHFLAPRALAAGDYHNLALLPDGTLFGWGRPLFITPTVPAGLSGVTAITCGIGYSGALKQDGTAVMWGNPPSGITILPSNLGLLGGLTAGGYHALAMVSVPFGIAGNSGSEMKTFTVLNRGTLPLTGLALTLDGPDASRFSFTAPLQTTLAVGASTTFTVTFQTTAGGTRNATLHLASNDPDENPYNLSLTGSTGLTPIQAWRQLWFGDTSPYATHELIALPFQLLPDGRTPRFFRLAITIGGETTP